MDENFYKILCAIYNSLQDQEQAMVEQIVNKLNCNLTVCPCCRVDDFQHVHGCNLVLEVINDERIRGFII